MDKFSVKELRKLCKDKNIKGYSNKKKEDLIKMLKSDIQDIQDIQDIEEKQETLETLENKSETVIDEYNKDILKEQYKIHKDYISSRKKLKNIRLPCFPEDISENIIKFINHKNGDKTSNWNCKKGDLRSAIYGIQECKCFTSNGPISFSPTSEWDELLFLDATEWFDKDKFILYRTKIKRNSIKWNSIKVNKNETFRQQSDQGRRPRICWKDLYSQIKKDCEKVYEGTFNEIFS